MTMTLYLSSCLQDTNQKWITKERIPSTIDSYLKSIIRFATRGSTYFEYRSPRLVSSPRFLLIWATIHS